MSDLIKSMQDALEEFDAQIENPDNDFSEDFEDIDKGVTFDLNKAEDLDNVDEYVDAAPFLGEVAELVDRNTARLARATEASLSVIKAQSSLIEDLFIQVQVLGEKVDSIGATPQPTRGITDKGQADDLLKSISERSFSDTSADQELGLAPKPQANIVRLGSIRKPLVQALRKSWTQSNDTLEKGNLGQDILNLEAVDADASSAQAIALLSDSGRGVAREFIEKLTAAEQAAQ